MKKNLTGVLVAAATLSLGCLGLSLKLFSGSWQLWLAVSSPTHAPARLPTLEASPYPACAAELAQVLWDSDHSSRGASSLAHPGYDYPIVTYRVEQDRLTAPEYDPVPDSLEKLQADSAIQQEVWSLFTALIPSEDRRMITGLNYFSDGAGKSLGSVQLGDSPMEWILELDLVDMQIFPEMFTTLIHEYAHLLSLNENQVTPNWPMFETPRNDQVYQHEDGDCLTYFIDEGCTKKGSYLNQFFDRFWPGIIDEWLAIYQNAEESELHQAQDDFYQKHADQFVSKYAATSPTEDLAESFMYFIFIPAPTGQDVLDRKVLFFYDFPELVELRLTILENLCPYVE